MAYGDKPFNLTSLVVCAVAADGTHTGTPVRLVNGQQCQVEPQSAALDPLMGYGLVRELATILTHANFNLSQGGLDLAAWQIMAGLTLTESGVSPNKKSEAHRAAGGEGLPYFALIGSIASVNGSNIFMGLPKCKLDTVPSLQIQQNQFVIPSVAGKAIANESSSYTDTPFILKTNETAGVITLSSAYFDTFFGITP